MYGYIYLTTNLINNKKYIGQHKSDTFDIKYLDSGAALKNALKKYGRKNFRCEILKECDSIEEMNEQEIYFIQLFNATKSDEFYNVHTGGNNVADRVCYSTEEVRAKISKANKGKVRSDKFKENLRQLELGKIFTDETRQKISDALKGHIVTDEARKKISDAHLGKPTWNKGRKCTEEERRINSETHKGKRWMHLGTPDNLEDVTLVKACDVQKYLDLGYEFGRIVNK